MNSLTSIQIRRKKSEPISSVSPMWAIALFLAPLGSVVILQLVGRQFVMGWLARSLDFQGVSVEVGLASFVVAFSLAWLAGSPVQGLGILVLGWGGSKAKRLRIYRFAFGLTVFSTALLGMLAYTTLGASIIMALQGLSAPLTQHVQHALKPFIVWPLCIAVLHVASNILKRRGQSGRLAIYNFGGLFMTGAVLLLGTQLGFHPLRVAVISLLAGNGVRGGLCCLAVLAGNDQTQRPDGALIESSDTALSWKRLLLFYLPVMGNTFLMTSSRPMIQYFLAAQPDPEVVLAAFGVAVMLSQVFYGWLNETRTLATTFRKREDVRKKLSLFSFLLGLSLASAMALIFWTSLGHGILADWMGLKGVVLEQATLAMRGLVFGPLVVVLRAYFQGLAVYQKRTLSWFTSAMVRVGGMAAIMLLVPLEGVLLGVAALMGGFLVEGLALAWSLRRKPAVS